MDSTSHETVHAQSAPRPATMAWSCTSLALAACSAVVAMLARQLWHQAWYVTGGGAALLMALLPLAAWLYAAASAGAILRRIRPTAGAVRAVLAVALLLDAVALMALVVVVIDFLRA